MQSYSMPEQAFDALQDRRGVVRTLTERGVVHVREVYTGTLDRRLHEQMDQRRAQLAEAGATDFHRTRIGRNTSCPCGSGRKFKKCCIDKAVNVG